MEDIPLKPRACRRMVPAVVTCLLAMALTLLAPAAPARADHHATAPKTITRADRIQALALNFFPKADRVGALEGFPPAAPVYLGSFLLGYVFLTDDIIKIPAYSGQPISTLVGLNIRAVIAGL